MKISAFEGQSTSLVDIILNENTEGRKVGTYPFRAEGTLEDLNRILPEIWKAIKEDSKKNFDDLMSQRTKARDDWRSIHPKKNWPRSEMGPEFDPADEGKPFTRIVLDIKTLFGRFEAHYDSVIITPESTPQEVASDVRRILTTKVKPEEVTDHVIGWEMGGKVDPWRQYWRPNYVSQDEDKSRTITFLIYPKFDEEGTQMISSMDKKVADDVNNFYRGNAYWGD